MITVQEMPNVAQRLTPHVNTVLLAMTHARVQRERIDAMERAVLARQDGSPMYQVAEKWRKRGRDEWVTDPKHSYLMSAEDFADYNAECQHRIKQMGYKVPDGHCPALIAEHVQVQAEYALMLAAEEFFDIGPDDVYLEKRRKYLDLLIGLVVNAPGYRKPELTH